MTYTSEISLTFQTIIQFYKRKITHKKTENKEIIERKRISKKKTYYIDEIIKTKIKTIVLITV